MRSVIAVSLLSVFLASCAITPELTGKAESKECIVGYLFQGDSLVNPDSLHLGMVTDLMYAFANIKGDTITEGFKNDAENFRILDDARRKYPNLKILISVGGWEWSGGFSNMCLTSESRGKFIGSAVRFIQKYNLDGIDIDWEYPGLPGAGNVHRPEDRRNFTDLLGELRMALDSLGMKNGRHYLITIAAGAFENYLKHTDLAEDVHYLDFINLMTYEMSSPAGDSLTGHNAPLFANPRDPRSNSDDKAVEEFIAAGVPPSKIVLGVQTGPRAPETFKLYQNYPNPFNPTTVIKFDVRGSGLVSLKVYNVLGQLVKTLVDKVESPGSHAVTFDAAGLASGV